MLDYSFLLGNFYAAYRLVQAFSENSNMLMSN